MNRLNHLFDYVTETMGYDACVCVCVCVCVCERLV
jgi:hypothetical protein